MVKEIEILEDAAIACDFCAGDALDLVPVGEFRVCLNCLNPKMECCE